MVGGGDSLVFEKKQDEKKWVEYRNSNVANTNEYIEIGRFITNGFLSVVLIKYIAGYYVILTHGVAHYNTMDEEWDGSIKRTQNSIPGHWDKICNYFLN